MRTDEEIIKDINKTGSYFVINAIIDGVRKGLRDSEFIKALERNKKNTSVLLEVPVYVFAVAGLHILGIEQYSGADEVTGFWSKNIQDLIDCNMQF